MQDDVALVGYSLGGVFLAKYLSEEVLPIRIATLHLVAAPFGWNGGFSLDSSLKSIEKQCSHIYIYQSKDDPLVEYKDAEKLKEQLPTAELRMCEARGHFFQPEFPELIANIQKTA